MFRCNLELATDVMGANLFQEGGLLVHHYRVKTDAGADEYFLDTIELPDTTQGVEVG